jgi:DNA repair protein RadA/Sms
MKSKTLFECIECGFQSPKFYGKCPQCNAWNSIVESEGDEAGEPAKSAAAHAKAVRLDTIDSRETTRLLTDIPEFDRVLGGGIVPDSVILIGGEPGVGKSTLLLEVAGHLCQKDKTIVYFSGEESAQQIKMRADRLQVKADRIHLLTLGTLEALKACIAEVKPDFLIVDSIQTIHAEKMTRIAGSLAAIRYLTGEIIELARTHNLTTFIIGHITKEGQLAGPKTLEHMVDVVLYFQGEIQTDMRLLRAEKNRFGPINEIGIFQMTAEGLLSVKDPSHLFLHARKSNDSGIAIYPTLNGMRSILVEVQALVTETPFVGGNPRRIAIGFDSFRLAMLISILEKKLKIPFYKSDVFLNVTGGMSIKESSGDVAVAAALLSSYKNVALKKNASYMGEVGLTGEIRPISFLEIRCKEAVRNGLHTLFLPAAQADSKFPDKATVHGLNHIRDIYEQLKSTIGEKS